MAQMRLRTRITLGFISILVLLAVIAVVAVAYLARTANGIDQYRGWARNANLMNDAQLELVNARMSLKDFLLRGTTEERQAYQQRYDQFRADHVRVQSRGRYFPRATPVRDPLSREGQEGGGRRPPSGPKAPTVGARPRTQ
jgi:methyl-accepting chemotaxis protein